MVPELGRKSEVHWIKNPGGRSGILATSKPEMAVVQNTHHAALDVLDVYIGYLAGRELRRTWVTARLIVLELEVQPNSLNV